MFSGMFRNSTHVEAVAQPDFSKLAQLIDTSFEDIRAKFKLAFAEGKSESLTNKEFIKQDVFCAMWRMFEKKPLKDFPSLEALDAYYDDLLVTLPVRIKNYCDQPRIRALASQAGLDEILSSYKINMLLEIARLYHALMRCKFQLQTIINKHEKSVFSPEDCFPGVVAFKQQCELLPELIRDIDVDLYRSRYVESIIQMNHSLIKLFGEYGYGQVDVEAIMAHDDAFKTADHELISFYHELRKLLPLTGDMVELVQEKPNPERTKQLQEAVIRLELARNLLADFKEKMIAHHFKKMDTLDNECNGLRRRISALRDDDKYKEFFADLRSFAKMLVNDDSEKGKIGLKNIADQVVVCAGQQTIGARLRNNGWSEAIICVEKCNHELDKATDRLFASYTNSIRTYNSGMKLLASLNNNWLSEVTEIMHKWNLAIKDADYVFNEIETLIDSAQGVLGRSAESNAEYWKGFVKRHWWKGALVASVLSGGGAAIAVTVIHSLAATIALPSLGVLLGGAGGAAWGFGIDSKKPPKPEVKVPADEREAHDTGRILGALYESESSVVRKDKEEMPLLRDEEDSHLHVNLDLSDEAEDEDSAPSIEALQRLTLFGNEIPDDLDSGVNNIRMYRLE